MDKDEQDDDDDDVAVQQTAQMLGQTSLNTPATTANNSSQPQQLPVVPPQAHHLPHPVHLQQQHQHQPVVPQPGTQHAQVIQRQGSWVLFRKKIDSVAGPKIFLSATACSNTKNLKNCIFLHSEATMTFSSKVLQIFDKIKVRIPSRLREFKSNIRISSEMYRIFRLNFFSHDKRRNLKIFFRRRLKCARFITLKSQIKLKCFGSG